MKCHLSSQIHDIVTAHVLGELHRETSFLSDSTICSQCYQCLWTSKFQTVWQQIIKHTHDKSYMLI